MSRGVAILAISEAHRICRFGLPLLQFAVPLILLSACGLATNTLAQDLAWERWEKCKHFRGITLKEIKTDGQIWVWASDGSEQTAWRACDSAAAREQGTRRTAASSQTAPSQAPPGQAPTGATAMQSGSLPLPTWKTGSEWAYRYENLNSAGTFVWSVDRVETLEGQAHYVLKTGTRELFYRVADLAFTKETVEGQVVRQISPSDWRFVAFPLVAGKSWDMKYSEVRPIARETEEIQRTCLAEAEETLTVPAGTFSTVRVTCKNARNGAKLVTIWYSPLVGHMVREETPVTGGKRVRELISYRLR